MSDDKNFHDEFGNILDDTLEDTKEVFSEGKNIAIIAHITLIGLIIAFVMNSNDKNEFASFYIRQMLGLTIFAAVTSFIPIIGMILNILFIGLWVVSLIGAIGGVKRTIPILGDLFQNWFMSL